MDERETEGRIPLRVDFSLPSNDETLRQFGGAASYEIEFDGTGLGESTILGLGEVHSTSEVTLNEVPLGWHWWGRHRYSLAGALREGRNVLRIKVTTVLVNLMRHKTDDPAAQRWASWAPPIPAGLLGPVRLIASPRAVVPLPTSR